MAVSDDARSVSHVIFPSKVEDFEADARVSFSKLEGKWILEEDNGSEWAYDDQLRRWIPSLDEALIEKQRQAYTGDGSEEPESTEAQKKRKTEDEDSGRSKKKSKPPKVPIERKNTAVYVTSLPHDVTLDEVHQVFSRCGVIAEEIDSGQPRIKLYQSEDGKFKGDALIVYFRAESVRLAIQMLDDTDFRLGEQVISGKMTVKEADFSYKKVQDKTTAQKTGTTKDQKKIMQKTQKLNSKLADWDDDDPQALQSSSSKFDKVVILKHMFTLEELEDDVTASLDIKDDIRDECSKLGEVTSVTLYDQEPDGVARIKFTTSEAAEACVRLMAGRHFDGRTVEARISDGSERFRKTAAKKNDENEDGTEAAAEKKRLDKFGKWLEGDAK